MIIMIIMIMISIIISSSSLQQHHYSQNTGDGLLCLLPNPFEKYGCVCAAVCFVLRKL